MANIIHIEINHRLLIWARESIAMSKNQASERTGISGSRLSQLEGGNKKPTLDELKELAKVYKRTLATLLLSEPPKEKPLPKDRRSVNSKDIGKFHEKTIIAVRKARALAQSYVELRQELGIQIPNFKISASLKNNPKDVAKKVSDVLHISEVREISNINLALDSYIEKVESLGIAVFQLTLTKDNLRGLSIVDDVVPIIGIKRGQEPAHSKTFTLFHELGHVILNQGGLCDLSLNSDIEIEKWCNSFAAGILIPKEDLIQSEIVNNQRNSGNKIWNKMDLIKLGSIFHVGPLAILRSLLDNKLTTTAFYNEKHIAWNKPQFGRAKESKGRELHKESLQERGRTYVSLAFSAFDQNRIDLKDLSDFLGLKISYIPKTRQLLTAY
ncbi:MAG TPA: XRE family transcriptional regulator [Ferruginibacter sp.]|nr:ImmA/IrrE family metallo-endopeptidase [Bacteroidota bacterium]MBS1925726.1 ImmA/IrrE family metallo-endopeptidase [Bacteroidota bacterium]MCC6691985.1 ImmA/IrrE family metallo-endopeptidase [Chitinophagaceae bacterium]HMT95684.1 XRE family transcriptional regulator [Ferruginibacter sp.]HMU25235.1 XRE family transcriptional regulator [Ferruginibacter sp.]